MAFLTSTSEKLAAMSDESIPPAPAPVPDKSRATAEVPPKGDKRRVRQAANRAVYDRDTLHAILDACSIGHVAFVHEGWPQSIPTAIARIDDGLWLHGSRSSRLYQVLAAGERVAVSVCLVDALIKARSAFHCSMNYRSAVVFGYGEPVSGDRKRAILDRFTEKLIPGSAADLREHLDKELKATELVRLPLDDASCKVRTGDPVDDEEDLELPYWAGQIPLVTTTGTPIPSSDLSPGIVVPDTLKRR